MDFVLSDEQEMVRDTVRAFLADRASLHEVRRVMETDLGFSPDLWSDLAELGMLGIHIPEKYGGAGFTFRELGLVMEELGRALTPLPFLSSVVLGAGAILLAGSPGQKTDLLPRIAAGDLRVALAVTEPDGDWATVATNCVAEESGAEVVLSGTKSFVLDGHTADVIIIAARSQDGRNSLYLVPGDAAGLQRTRLETMDMTRRLARIQIDAVVIPAESRLGPAGSAEETLETLYDQAAAGLACEQLGGALACLEAAVEYAKVRHQFGRPIGSFQAVKHKCADMLMQLESAKSAAYHACWAAVEDPAELRVAAPLAKSFCSEAYFEIAGDNIQVHGGIGFTWEHDAHLYFKRAKSSQLLFGDPGHWRTLLASRMGVH